MKSTIALIKKHTWWIGHGSKRAVLTLINWLQAPSDKEIVKRRLFITVAVPMGVIMLASEHPAVAVTVSFSLFILVTAWFGHVEAREMTMRGMDYEQPYSINGRVIHGSDILQWLVDNYPGESLQQLRDRLFYELDGPDVTPEVLGRQMAVHGVSHKEVRNPSPTASKGAPSSGVTPGQDHAEGVEEGAEKKQGRGKPHQVLARFTNRLTSYHGSPDKHEENPGEHPGAPSPSSLVPPQGEQGEPRTETDQDSQVLAGTDLRDHHGDEEEDGPRHAESDEGSVPDGGLPGEERRHAEVPSPMA